MVSRQRYQDYGEQSNRGRRREKEGVAMQDLSIQVYKEAPR